MPLIISGEIDLDSLIFRDQAKALNALADLEDLKIKRVIKFKMDGVPTLPKEPVVKHVKEKKTVPTAQQKILDVIADMKNPHYIDIQKKTKLATNTLSPNLSRMVQKGLISRNVDADFEMAKKVSRDNLFYTLPKVG